MSYHDLDKLLDDTEKSYRLTQASVDPEARKTSCVSTGLLSLDLFFGGGYIGGAWYTFFGGEQSAKSTSLSTAMAMLANAGVKGTYWDFEGSSDPSYQSNIVSRIAHLANMKKDGKVITVDDVFGVRNPDTGKYVVPPIFRLYTESIGDKMFDSMSALVKALPDKVFVNGKWYYVYDEKPKGDIKVDRKLSSRNSYYVEAENPHPELAIFADSYPAMYPETLDDGKGQGMAAVARMFSENIPKIAGRLRKKGIVVIGVNQLRQRPGVMFGCFQGSSLVTMADGTLKPIAQLVKERSTEKVLSYDKKTGEVVAKRIKNWYINGQTKDGWLKFMVRGGNKQGNGQRVLKVTPNHLIMDEHGKMKHACEFSEGDKVRIISDSKRMTEVQKQLVLGSILGDGCWKDTYGGVALTIQHKVEHHALTKWKRKLMKNLCVAKSKNEYHSWFQTTALQEDWFLDVVDEARSCGHTMKFSETLFKSIDLFGLAVWYMDDAQKSRHRCKLQSYSVEDAQRIVDVLNKKFGEGSFTFQRWKDKYAKTGEGWGLKFNTSIMTRIAPFIHDVFHGSMVGSTGYKYFGHLLGTAVPKPEYSDEQFTTCGTITSITPWSCYKGFLNSENRGYEDPNKYDLEIEDTHLYCVDGVIVHNSPEYEPAGEAVKFISSVRIKNAARAVPHGKGQVEQERSVLMDGDDEYQYICMRTQKNKQYNSTGLESWQRVWKTDPQGNAHGFDPVWNVYDYLLLTGQATRFGTGAKRKIDLNILDATGRKTLYEVEGLDWWDFKALILYQGKDRTEHAKELGLTPKVYKELFAEGKLYEHCRKQILNGCAINLAFQLKNGVGVSEDEEDEEDEEE